MMQPIALLKQIPLFEPLEPADQEQLAALLRKRSVSRGAVLFRKGDEGTALYIIIRGRIRITIRTKAGDEITLAILNNGEFLGEMALLDGMPRSADATALDETQLYVLNRSDFLSFLTNNARAVQTVLQALSLRLRNTDDLLAEICFSSLSSRLARRLAEMAATDNASKTGTPSVRLTQKELASMLGTTRESVNKELKILRDRGILSTARNLITIHQPEGLRRRIR
jgi:CRP/FNR family cyclic AMP-dependent transcriptional regulator